MELHCSRKKWISPSCCWRTKKILLKATNFSLFHFCLNFISVDGFHVRLLRWWMVQRFYILKKFVCHPMEFRFPILVHMWFFFFWFNEVYLLLSLGRPSGGLLISPFVRCTTTIAIHTTYLHTLVFLFLCMCSRKQRVDLIPHFPWFHL